MWSQTTDNSLETLHERALYIDDLLCWRMQAQSVRVRAAVETMAVSAARAFVPLLLVVALVLRPVVALDKTFISNQSSRAVRVSCLLSAWLLSAC